MVIFFFLFKQIPANEIDFWGGKIPLDRMKLMHKEQMYPPKVTVLVYSNRPGSREAAVDLEIKGMRRDKPAILTVVKTFGVGKL